jgi:MFS family permease
MLAGDDDHIVPPVDGHMRLLPNGMTTGHAATAKFDAMEVGMRPFYARELTRYPVGARRIRYLLMAVLASLIVNFEGQIAPVVPLLLEDLDMTLATYGLLGAAAVTVGGVSAAIGGRYADRYGRVVFLVPALFLTALCDFATVLVHTPAQLLIVRSLLLLVEGAAITTTAGLVRDFSPRLGRATAFGFWTWGPVGASFLAAGIAAVTLPMFGSWRSQFVIIGIIALACSALITCFIADLSPELRDRAILSESDMARTADTPAGARPAAAAGTAPEATAPDATVPLPGRRLRSSRVFWAHVAGMTLWLVWYWTMQIFGPTILVQAFGLSDSQAAVVIAATWALNLLALVAAGWLSDRLQTRKPIMLAGALGGLVGITYLIVLVDAGQAGVGQLIVVNALLGAVMAAAYAPWMALFSEDVEDLRPDLQATAWGAYGLVVRLMIVVVLLIAPTIAAGGSGWARWLVVALVCNALFVPAIFLFGGAWRPTRRDRRRTPEAVAAESV